MSSEKIDEIEKRCNAAEGKRWRCIRYRDIDKRIQIAPDDEPYALAWVDNDDTQHGPANSRFIASAKQDIQTLIAMLRTARRDALMEAAALIKAAEAADKALTPLSDIGIHAHWEDDAMMTLTNSITIGDIRRARIARKNLADALTSLANERTTE